METHPLAEALRRAAAGAFPPPDGTVEVLGSPPGASDAVVAFTGHTFIAADVDETWVRAALPDDDFGAPMSAPFLTALGERLGAPPGMIDAVLVAEAREGPADPLRRLADRSDRARVERAHRYRRDVTVYGDEDGSGVVIIGRGLADRWEVSIDLAEEHRERGVGRRFAALARSLVPPDELLYAQVTPGNARSVRAFLAAGYRPIASEVLFLRGS